MAGARAAAEEVPGAIRASLGLGSREEDVDRLAGALREIALHGPRWTYRAGPDGSVVPDPDDRPWPAFLGGCADRRGPGAETGRVSAGDGARVAGLAG